MGHRGCSGYHFQQTSAPPGRLTVKAYVCQKCGYRVTYRPCLICDTRRARNERPYTGPDDSGEGLGLSPEEERLRQEVLRHKRDGLTD